VTTIQRPTYVDGSDALVVLDGSAKSCERYAEMQRQTLRHQSMLDQINAAFSA
jgi:hypothetical protein